MRQPLWWASAAALAALLLVAAAGGSTLGQRPAQSADRGAVKARTATPERMPSIEEMVATALKYNPDIRLAETKLRDDEAELNRTRLRVIQRIIAVHHALQAQRAEIERERGRVKRLGGLVRDRALQRATLDEAEQDLARARARLEELRSELPYLLGRRAEGMAEEIVRNEFQIGARASADLIRPAMAARIRKALDRSVKIDYKEVALKDLLRDLAGQSLGVPVQLNLALADLGEVRFAMRLGEVPLGSALLALQDTLPGLRVVARNYGILLTWEHQVPLGAVRLFDFWKNSPR
jgi:hypothetical protein